MLGNRKFPIGARRAMRRSKKNLNRKVKLKKIFVDKNRNLNVAGMMFCVLLSDLPLVNLLNSMLNQTVNIRRRAKNYAIED